jgi:hypothetical protein
VQIDVLVVDVAFGGREKRLRNVGVAAVQEDQDTEDGSVELVFDVRSAVLIPPCFYDDAKVA